MDSIFKTAKLLKILHQPLPGYQELGSEKDLRNCWFRTQNQDFLPTTPVLSTPTLKAFEFVFVTFNINIRPSYFRDTILIIHELIK